MEQKNNKKEMGLEERFAAIELILDQMEDENVTLDESFELYKKGMEQMKAANQALDQIEKAMLVMNESGELEEF
jgi:exodeoxyribonuclease VII small subunit